MSEERLDIDELYNRFGSMKAVATYIETTTALPKPGSITYKIDPLPEKKESTVDDDLDRRIAEDDRLNFFPEKGEEG